MQACVRNAYVIVFKKIYDGTFGTFGGEDDDMFETEGTYIRKVVCFGEASAVKTRFDDCKMVWGGDNSGFFVCRGIVEVLETAATAFGGVLGGDSGQRGLR